MSTAAKQVEAGLAAIGERIASQDNRATAAPIFIVQQRRRIYGLDTDYTDHVAWIDTGGDCDEATGRRARALEARYQRTGEEPAGWSRTGYMDVWEFVTACFTEQGCKDYIAVNGYNLRDPRIYAEGSYRNAEWQTVRDWLLSLAPTVAP